MFSHVDRLPLLDGPASGTASFDAQARPSFGPAADHDVMREARQARFGYLKQLPIAL
jgi:hypothetical protein